MARDTPRHRVAAQVAVLIVVAVMLPVLASSAGAAAGYVPISGSGSTWSLNALDQWRKNVTSLYGIQINFSPNGSTNGRNDFRAGLVDYAVSEIPYGLNDGGQLDVPPKRAFGYMPIVAGGTSFMYNLKIGNDRVTNLRLSGETIAKIFTQQITNWSDPMIKADNPGLSLPARRIVPVVYSNGSGTTAQFTTWMASQFPAIWDDYCHRNGRNLTPCGFTSFYPLGPGMEAKPQSQGVSGFVAQATSEGAITYVEYSYARNARFPVAKVLNKANYYVEPKAGSVAVALLKARINPEDLTQDLSQVYVDTDPRTYPLSSYSYMILPKDTTANFNTEKGRSLSEFGAYFLCEGQQQADTLGYSPLPINLVQAGADQINQIPGSTKRLDRNNLAHCNNPTVSPDGGNKVANDAPRPSPCDRLGAPTQCAEGTGGALALTPTKGTTGAKGTNPAGTNPANPSGTNARTDPTATDTPTAAPDPATGASPIDSETGQPIDESTLTSGSGSVNATAVPVSVDAVDDRQQLLLTILTVVVLLGLALGPPLLAYTVRNRQGPRT